MLTNPPRSSSLRGVRILVVEDEMLVSMLLEDMLSEFGCKVVGPATHLAKAVDLATVEVIDAAILDVNVGGKEVYPAAKKLAERGIPFAFVTGYGAGAVNEHYRERPTLQKPFHVAQLEKILGLMLNRVPR